jgi:hypothetical protein
MGAVDNLMKQLAAALRKVGLGHLTWALGRSRLVEAIRRLNTRPTVQQPLSARQKKDLQRLFGPDVDALSKLLKRDLHEIWCHNEPLVSD